MTDFEFFVSIGIYLLWAIRLCQKIGYFESYDVQFLHFTAKNGTISSKFPVHKNENVKILCRTGGWDFMKLHFGYLMVCTKMWYGANSCAFKVALKLDFFQIAWKTFQLPKIILFHLVIPIIRVFWLDELFFD